ncbi:teichoic acid transport system permease protein [Streptohalobacillus salinus]|uniref:Transport permease protein n=1 Tax=Streptohalobacillus salinus TaxID=621096 RepID=A0A2V3WFI3_9BACI|nr:ABC transporter permease [Streptohalobacillus salinus]PXW92026.1 teichoic acid transport system permease protein [Streptohalobacillus salinus]
MKSIFTVLKEQYKYAHLIRRLSLYELKSNNKNNYLGMAWEVINPVIQILIYWLVFGTLMQREAIIISGQEIPFINWLIGGFFVWTFFYQATIQGSKSVYTRLKMLAKMSFPMSVIPSYVIFSQFYIHLFSLGVTVIIYLLIGQSMSIYLFQIIFYMIAALMFVFSLSLITSTLSTIIRDVHMLLNSILRMFLYLSGVLWPITLLSDYPILKLVMSYNPVYYLIEGYRISFFGDYIHFIEYWKQSLFFFGLTFTLLLFGSYIHVKFRKYFIDYL